MQNEPAFPCEDPKFDSVDFAYHHGLTKREWFAGMAMQGLCASPKWSTESYEQLSDNAVRQADALIAELDKSNGSSGPD